jgi:hypothetical protein
MAAIEWVDVVALASSLSTVPIAAQTEFLDFVNPGALGPGALNVSKFGGETAPKTRLARIYLVAHFATLFQQGSIPIAGPVTAEARGGVSRSYALVAASSSSSGLGQTNFGQLYEALVRTSLARLPMVPR